MSTQTIERATQVVEKSALVVFRERLLERRSELDAALESSGISTERFIRTAVTAVQTNPDLLSDISFQAMWIALQQSARDQIPPDGVRGVIYAFKREAKWVPMVRGMIERFQRSGEFKWIAADFHREDDLAFDVWVDEHGQHFLHRPGPREGRIIETYAAATTKSGGFFLTVISEPDMQRIKNVSTARSVDAPWQKWPEPMMLKTAIKRLCKILPMPQELEEMIHREDESDAADASTPKQTPLPRPRSAQAALNQFAGGNTAEHEPERTDATTGEITTGNEPQEETTAGSTIPQVRIDTAHQRGIDDNKAGMKRSASPPEYREPGREAEMTAWWRGWDGKPLGD